MSKEQNFLFLKKYRGNGYTQLNFHTHTHISASLFSLGMDASKKNISSCPVIPPRIGRRHTRQDTARHVRGNWHNNKTFKCPFTHAQFVNVNDMSHWLNKKINKIPTFFFYFLHHFF